MAGRRPSLLSLSVDEAVTRIARDHIQAGTRVMARLKNPSDPRGLHAFRVAIRRLRSLLRAYRPWLGTVAGRKVRRKLRDLTRATNALRDIDVELAWLATAGPALSGEDRPGFNWLRRRLTGSRRLEYRQARARLRRDFPKAARFIRRRMNGKRAKGSPSYRAAFLELLDAHVSTLRERLSAIAGSNDAAAAHKARIEVKRLRYLVEPLRNERAEAREAIRPLKKLQTVLGELHDTYVLDGALASALDEAAAEKARRLHRLATGGRRRKAVADARRPDEALGLVVLAARARDEREELFEKFRRRVGSAGPQFLAAELSALRAAAAPH